MLKTWYTWLGVLLTCWHLSATLSSADLLILADSADAMTYHTGIKPSDTGNYLPVGVEGSASDRRLASAVVPFLLPEGLQWDEVESARLEVYLASKTTPIGSYLAPQANVDVHVLPIPRTSPTVQAGDYQAEATLVLDDFITIASATKNWYAVENAQLTQAVKYALAAGTTLQERYLFVRLSYDLGSLTGNVANYNHHYKLTARDADDHDITAPRLSLTLSQSHHPEPGSALMLLILSCKLLTRQIGRGGSGGQVH